MLRIYGLISKSGHTFLRNVNITGRNFWHISQTYFADYQTFVLFDTFLCCNPSENILTFLTNNLITYIFRVSRRSLIMARLSNKMRHSKENPQSKGTHAFKVSHY